MLTWGKDEQGFHIDKNGPPRCVQDAARTAPRIQTTDPATLRTVTPLRITRYGGQTEPPGPDP